MVGYRKDNRNKREIVDRNELDKIIQRLNYTDDLNKRELILTFGLVYYLDIKRVEAGKESYDLVNVYSKDNDIIIAYYDKCYYDKVKVLERSNILNLKEK